MITILLSGQARVGKTTAAEFIADYAKKNDFKPVILPFAKSIKDEAAAAGLSKDTDPHGYRKYCQEIGEGKRKDDPDYWLNLFIAEWRKLSAKDAKAAQDETKLWKETVVIVDDCRYLNELNFGRLNGAITVFLSHGKRELFESTGEWRNHESEDMANRTENGNKDYVQMFDWIIKNETSLSDLHAKLFQRLPLWLGLVPESYVECNCISCSKNKKDESLTLEEFLEDLMGEEDED